MLTVCKACGAALPIPKVNQVSIICPSCETEHDLASGDVTQAGPKVRNPIHAEQGKYVAEVETEPAEEMSARAGPEVDSNGTDVQATGEAFRVAAAPMKKARPLHRARKATPRGRDLTGLTLADTYDVNAFVCQGGMGSIWIARDRHLDCEVAVKVLLDALSADESHRENFLQRFRNEAKTLAKVRGHRNLVSIYSLGEYPGDDEGEGFPFLVMDLVLGPEGKPLNLAERIKAGDLGFDEAVNLFLQTCDALEYVHQRKVWHRDIKPANILIDSEGHARLTDFGIARREDVTSGGVTAPTDGLGSLNYMSPEQKSDPTAVDARSDIYSMGVTFFEMLTGKLPGGHGWELKGPQFKGCAKPLNVVLRKAMGSDPSQRYSSIREMADSVRLATGKQGISRFAVGVGAMVAVAVVSIFLAVHGGRESAPSGNANNNTPASVAAVSTPAAVPAPAAAPVASSPPAAPGDALMAAVNNGDVASATDLVNRDPSLFTRDALWKGTQTWAAGQTILHYIAAQPDSLKNEGAMVDALAKVGKRFIDKQDDDGQTAAHLAAYMVNKDAFYALVRAGADLTIRRRIGNHETPVDLVQVGSWLDDLNLRSATGSGAVRVSSAPNGTPQPSAARGQYPTPAPISPAPRIDPQSSISRASDAHSLPPKSQTPAVEPELSGKYEATIGAVSVALTFSRRDEPWHYVFKDQAADEVTCTITDGGLITFASRQEVFPFRGDRQEGMFTYSGSWDPRTGADGDVTSFDFVPAGGEKVHFRQRR